ncbi:MAG: hypothetical protein JW937_04500 [Candidatus Omnitrophica bacterium]|nr:hypothetical protein [Candidatus Omnitrophota bacterium]
MKLPTLLWILIPSLLLTALAHAGSLRSNEPGELIEPSKTTEPGEAGESGESAKTDAPAAGITLVIDTSKLKEAKKTYFVPGKGLVHPSVYLEYKEAEYQELLTQNTAHFAAFGTIDRRLTEYQLWNEEDKMKALRAEIAEQIRIYDLLEAKSVQDRSQPSLLLSADGEEAVIAPPPEVKKVPKTGNEESLVSTEDDPYPEPYNKEWDKYWSW